METGHSAAKFVRLVQIVDFGGESCKSFNCVFYIMTTLNSIFSYIEG